MLASPASVRPLSALAVGLWLALAGCRETAGPPARIGIVLSSDGVVGAQMAAADLQSAAGARGRPIELRIIREGASAAAPALMAADSLAADPSVLAVVGHSNSASSLAASQVYNARRLAQIAPTTTSPLFTRAGAYSFRLVPDDSKQAVFLVRQIPPEVRRVAILYVSDDYGRALADGVRRRLGAEGRQVVYESPYREGAEGQDMDGLRRPVADARPDQILWLGRSPELRRFLDGKGSPVPILAGDGVENSVLYSEPAAFANVRFVRFLDPNADGLRQFGARFRAANGREPTAEAALAYDAVALFAAALHAGARTREEVRDRIAAVGRTAPAYHGLTGPIAFDVDGDVVRPYLLAEVTPSGVRAVTAR